MAWYKADGFEWDEAASQECRRRTGFDFHAAKAIFANKYLEREADTETSVPVITASGMLGDNLITVMYIENDGCKRIVDAFKADRDEILDYVVIYGL